MPENILKTASYKELVDIMDRIPQNDQFRSQKIAMIKQEMKKFPEYKEEKKKGRG
jgi:hypothetical protein